MASLSSKTCTPCTKSTSPLIGKPLLQLHKQLGSYWQLIDEHHIEREYRFPNFKEALAFVNRVGSLAESEGHHPDITLSWGRVKIQLCTHKINGLSENDFILASKCDALIGPK
jgi:4a-hydroxytetrahydrobiopterin dehydratase